MAEYTAAFVGTGPDPKNPMPGESFAQAYTHAPGYEAVGCEIVACADPVRENAEAFAMEYGIPSDGIFEDHEEMLAAVEPDLVSVCTPVPTHAPIVLDCIHSGVVEAVHCEKPMADTWGDARLVAQEAARHGVQVTFNHQRRFDPAWRRPKALLDDGEVGDLLRLEVSASTLFDNGTHVVDVANFYAGDRPAEWVLGNVDYREEQVKYGAHNANQTVAQWAYGDGVHGFAATGHGTDVVGAANRVVGTAGEIEVHPCGVDAAARIRRADDTEWQTVDVEPEDHETTGTEAAIEHAVTCLGAGNEPQLSARRALNATEILFGVYESARRRGRVEFPLTVDDSPLAAMVESGALDPSPRSE